ncbi:MAG: hypothetical protein JSV91_14515 [Phycisphaerales bacterium]|nr:MAG: hypothetical protein JSV91_14515 [Phycisphaerales bacterium]
MTDFDTVTLQVNDTDLAQVLEMLSIQSKKNIITSKSVSATISANLFDVTFYEALDAILKVNGYRWVEEGNFIYIYTQSEWEEIEAAQRRTESRVFELDYLSASDANELITPLLSDLGQSSFRGDVADGIVPDIGDVGAETWAFSATIVVNDYPETLDNIAALLAETDVAPRQVLVEATILQTTLDEANAFGVDFSVLGSINFTDLTNPLAAVNNLLAGNDPTTGFQPPDNTAIAAASTVGNTAGAGGLKIGVVRDDMSAFLRVLDEVTDSKILAKPKIMCLNRQRAQVLVGAKVGYLSTTATETTTTQSVEFLDTGIQLVFRPFINKDGMIRLELAPKVSEASLRTVSQATGTVVTIPDELTNELTTNVRVRDGETLVLGGLFRESNRITRRQIPLFGDIPILGMAFRGQDDTVDRDEIIFLITPSVVHDETLWEMGEDTLEMAEAVRVGARAGLLPFSRERMTTNYNQDAIDAFNHGDVEKALYYINNSLRLNSGQPEMRRFRERVTGQLEPSYENSVMERVFRKELGALFEKEPQAFAPPGFGGRYDAPASFDHSAEGKRAADERWNREQRMFYTEFVNEFFNILGFPEMSPDFRTAADLEYLDSQVELAEATEQEFPIE